MAASTARTAVAASAAGDEAELCAEVGQMGANGGKNARIVADDPS